MGNTYHSNNLKNRKHVFKKIPTMYNSISDRKKEKISYFVTLKNKISAISANATLDNDWAKYY